MEIWEPLQGLGLGYILPFVFVLSIVVFFHELGHFWVARRCGVAVETFSIGFGRPFFKRQDRLGTTWQVGWLPLGGYVKFLGDENAASAPDHDSLSHFDEEARQKTLFYKPLWQRAAVVAAGPVANFILAIIIFTGLFFTYGQQVVRPLVADVMENSAAARAGLEKGDLIVEMNGVAVESFSDVQRIVSVSADTPIQFGIERNGAFVSVTATPDRVERTDRFGNVFAIGQLGVQASSDIDYIGHRSFGLGESMVRAVGETYFIVEQSFVMLGRIISGREGTEALGGPIRIAQISGQTATLGLIALINLTAVLSVSIGLVNLFPIPMLDGGHLMFYAYEALFGRPMSERVQDIGMRLGLGIVLTLFVFVTWNDLSHLGVFDSIANFFGS